MYFDSHCHLTDERLFGEADEAIRRAAAAGVSRIVTIGVGPDDAERALGIARRHLGVWATVGVHPHDAAGADAATLARVREIAADPRIVALGEMGLDYHYDHSPRDVQRRVFARQLELARELGLPVVIHSREAEADTIALIREAAAAGVAGVLHCFSSAAPLLDAGLEAGWYVSFAGLVTFRNFDGGDLVRRVPGDRLLAETDAPYLAPVPYRGKRNEPAFLPAVVAGLAAIRGEDAAALAQATSRNASRFYRLPAEAAAP
ncbi:MAG: TatD family hydrolase [Gemmatimonadetes bacterium]|nr:TatD family hydrolase [Gemmatimonadota bacterium]